MNSLELMVREFHEKHDFARDLRLSSFNDPTWSLELVTAGETLVALSKIFQGEDKDKRAARAHLLLEELGELLVSLGEGNEVDAYDGALDLIYVATGTCIAFSWPVQEGFAEVQRSNMTKEKQSSDPLKHRLRSKGPNYSPPKLEQILSKSRCEMPKMDRHSMGLYTKFLVQRTDNKDAPGCKHYGCEYFVLDLDHDPFAMPAIRAYANACATSYPALAEDLLNLVPAPLFVVKTESCMGTGLPPGPHVGGGRVIDQCVGDK